MDTAGFDRLARALAAPASRRAAVTAVLAAAAGGASLAAFAPVAQAGKGTCGPKRVRCGGRCLKKKNRPCCPDGNCSITTDCFRTNCAPTGAFRTIKMTIENRSGRDIDLELWHKDLLSGCHRDRKVNLANNSSTEYQSGAINALAWIDERYGAEADNPPIGTPFAVFVQDGSMSESGCYRVGSILSSKALAEGESAQQGTVPYTFKITRQNDTDEFKVFKLTITK
ncbi:MAG: hypothetical protein U0031_19630 [Thermomicrobiales bacterium]